MRPATAGSPKLAAELGIKVLAGEALGSVSDGDDAAPTRRRRHHHRRAVRRDRRTARRLLSRRGAQPRRDPRSRPRAPRDHRDPPGWTLRTDPDPRRRRCGRLGPPLSLAHRPVPAHRPRRGVATRGLSPRPRGPGRHGELRRIRPRGCSRPPAGGRSTNCAPRRSQARKLPLLAISRDDSPPPRGLDGRRVDDRRRAAAADLHVLPPGVPRGLERGADIASRRRPRASTRSPGLFRVSEPTMAARSTRAKRKIVEAGIPFATPPPHRLAERLEAVLAVDLPRVHRGLRGHGGLRRWCAPTSATRRSASAARSTN